MKKAIAIILIVVLAGGFIFGAYMLIKTLITAENERKKFESVVNIIDSEKGTEVNRRVQRLLRFPLRTQAFPPRRERIQRELLP